METDAAASAVGSRESDVRCPLNQGDSFLLLFPISTWTWFVFYRLLFTGKKSYAKKQLLATLLNTSLDLCLLFGRLTTLFQF